MWNVAKRSHTYVNRVPEKEKIDTATEAIFEEILAGPLPQNEEKYQTIQIQEAYK